MTFLLYLSAALIVALLLFFILEYSFLIPPVKGLPILMYHKVSEDHTDGLTVRSSDLETQFKYICDQGYSSISFLELQKSLVEKSPLPLKPIIITFDDAYESFSELVLPLLKKYRLKASLFVPVGFIGKTNEWDHGEEKISGVDEIQSLAMERLVEIGIHSFSHQNYKDLSPEKMAEDLQKCTTALESFKIPFTKVLAYPYGGFPKKDPDLNRKMKKIFLEHNLLFALRIGNRINRIPLIDPFELNRIDIKGTDNFFTFKIKLKKGREKLFS